ncbi:MAG: sigma-70 family RNA polymerase sigma factor [Kiritimatiellae bacterium]|nr:sigma-70 family RNA polymerase sigma factor [Kiritimatiellia bacterium]
MNADDHQLLTRFVEEGSEPAFRELVERYSGFVYSTAYRRLADHARAEDAVQSTFIILAKKAAKMSRKVSLGSWLYKTASLVCGHIVRTEIRRKKREETAVAQAEIRAALQEDAERTWACLQPVLDKALEALSARAREAVIARYLLGKSPGEIAAEQGINEKAAWARVDYGVKKLRERLAAMGVRVSGGVLAAVLAAKTAEAAPAGLAASAHSAAWGAFAGNPVAGAAALLSEQVMKLMVWAKFKLAAACAAVAVAAAGVAAPVAHRLLQPGRWNPGYYAMPAGAVSSVKPADAGQTDPLIRGLFGRYAWRQLEPADGIYDFSQIEADLHHVAALRKRLVAEICVRGNSGGAGGCVPDWLRGPRFGGGVYKGRASETADLPVFWNAAVQNRMRALIVALGRRFDAVPELEAVVAPSILLAADRGAVQAQPGVEPWTEAGALRAVRVQIEALKEGFPRTVTLQSLDWISVTGDRPYKELAAYAQQCGVGLHCAFVYPDGPRQIEPLYQRFPELAGRVPLAITVEQWQMKKEPDGSRITPAQMLWFGRNKLCANYIFWDAAGSAFENEILPILHEHGNVLDTRKPAALKGWSG